MNKRAPPFFCLLSRAPDTCAHNTHSSKQGRVGIPIIKNFKA